MIVLDTHVWIWWLDDPARLSQPARTAIEVGMREGGLTVSAMSAWEVALLVAKGRLVLNRDAAAWIEASAALPFVHFAPIDRRIAVMAVNLPDPLHADPADRIIAATAMSLGGELVTADRRLRDYPPVQTIW